MRIAKTFQDGTGFLTNFFKPGEGKTGAAGYASSALGFMAENKLRKMPELEAQALGVDVDSKQRILERAAVMPEISRMGLDETQRNLERSVDARHSHRVWHVSCGGKQCPV